MPQVPHIDIEIHGRCAAPDREMANLAGVQDGVVSRKELVGQGLGRGAIDHRVATGNLHVIHHGVYAVGHRALSRRGYLRAALLACGEAAVLSHRTAAHLSEISPTSSALIEITGSTHRRGGKGFRYRQSNLHPDDIAEVDGFPVTSVARTLLDLAGIVDRNRVERALERAVRLELFDLRTTTETIERNRGKKGTRLLTALIADFDPASPETRSGNERKFLRLLRQSNLPRPRINTLVEGFLVDCCWPQHNLIVEIDAYGTHGSKKAFHKDRDRDAVLDDAGYRVMRVTDRQLDHQPELVVNRVARALTRR